MQTVLKRSTGIAALAIAMSTGAAMAQTTPETRDEATAQSGDASDIVVTGTRIRRPELVSNSPLTTVGTQELALQGANNVENVLNRLPQFTPDANENVSNGSNGTAQVNLRNLGSSRVLTLVNGQRLLPTQAIDLNFVPSAIVERVDVATGGASAVYGSDALSGVVNFILRDHLDGIRLDAQSSIADHTNDSEFVRSIVAARGYTTAPRHVTDGGKQDINASVGKTFLDGRAEHHGLWRLSPHRSGAAIRARRVGLRAQQRFDDLHLRRVEQHALRHLHPARRAECGHQADQQHRRHQDLGALCRVGLRL
ncbi:MAG: TonB-dependent receptor plug domain-containing protein [Sphingomonas taxi]